MRGLIQNILKLMVKILCLPIILCFLVPIIFFHILMISMALPFWAFDEENKSLKEHLSETYRIVK